MPVVYIIITIGILIMRDLKLLPVFTYCVHKYIDVKNTNHRVGFKSFNESIYVNFLV